MSLKYLSSKLSQNIDTQLMSSGGFSIDQLMELAGLSCAQSIYSAFNNKNLKKVAIVCGPGNNGGDGLVCARHLKHFGYSPTIIYPKPSSKDLFKNLITQCKSLDIQVKNEVEIGEVDKEYELIVDAIFGFSFSGQIRPPFGPYINLLKTTKLPVISIDVPSGWSIDEEPKESDENYFMPTMLISLTAPKLCAKYFNGAYHYLGGRFIPKEMAEQLELNLPEYKGIDQFVILKNSDLDSKI